MKHDRATAAISRGRSGRPWLAQVQVGSEYGQARCGWDAETDGGIEQNPAYGS